MLQFEANKKENATDRECPHCLRYNPEGADTCRLCGQSCGHVHGLKQGQGHAARQKVESAAVSSPVPDAPPGLCLRNRTNVNVWVYTEQTAPLQWVQLRPGECCDMPTERVWYTIGASFDEPSPKVSILAQVGFGATILAAAVLCILPDPFSKAAVIAYIGGVIATAGSLTAGGTILGVSNQSKMKRAGILANGAVWDIRSTLESYTTLATGEKIHVYSYWWEDPNVDWAHRRDGWDAVDIKVKRDLDKVQPVQNEALANILAAAKERLPYIEKVDEWYKHGVLDQHVFPLGGDGGRWSQTTFSPPALADGRNGLITGVRIAASKFIDGVQVKYAGKTDWEPPCGNESTRKLGIFQSPQNPDDHLGRGGELICDEGDFINHIRVIYDKYVCRIDIRTYKGVQRIFGGKDADGSKTVELRAPYPEPANGWVGFKLEGDAWVDRMTFLMESVKV